MKGNPVAQTSAGKINLLCTLVVRMYRSADYDCRAQDKPEFQGNHRKLLSMMMMKQ
jgi:hypothetical protein